MYFKAQYYKIYLSGVVPRTYIHTNKHNLTHVFQDGRHVLWFANSYSSYTPFLLHQQSAVFFMHAHRIRVLLIWRLFNIVNLVYILSIRLIYTSLEHPLLMVPFISALYTSFVNLLFILKNYL